MDSTVYSSIHVICTCSMLVNLLDSATYMNIQLCLCTNPLIHHSPDALYLSIYNMVQQCYTWIEIHTYLVHDDDALYYYSSADCGML